MFRAFAQLRWSEVGGILTRHSPARLTRAAALPVVGRYGERWRERRQGRRTAPSEHRTWYVFANSMRIIAFLGGSVLAALVLGNACGGKAVIDAALPSTSTGHSGGASSTATSSETSSSGSTGDGGTASCAPKVLVGIVTNELDVHAEGSGLEGDWRFGELNGLEAGHAMCKAIGADHVCEYQEILAADVAGAFAAFPLELSFFLQRTTNVVDPTEPKPCAADKECTSGFCDVDVQVCSWKAGKGGNCNDWTTSSGIFADAEWFEVYRDGGMYNSGAAPIGSLSFFFDAYTKYTAVNDNLCHSSDKPGCAGHCGAPRAIPCCSPPCVK